MTSSNATQYADILTAAIRANSEAEAPFGWLNRQTDEWTSDPDETDESGDWQPGSAGDYLSDALDIRYIVSSDRKYHSAHIAVTLGGPNAWIHLDERELVVYWGGDEARRALPAEFIDGLDDYLDEMWQAGA